MNSTFPKSSNSVLQKLAAKKKIEEGTKETKKEKEKEKEEEKEKGKNDMNQDKVLSKSQNKEFDSSKQTNNIERLSKDRKRDKNGTGPRDDGNDGMEGSSSGMHGTEIDGRTPGLPSRMTATVNPAKPANVNRKNSLSPTCTDLEDSLNGFAPAQNSEPQKNLGKIKTPFFPRGKILKMEIYSTWGDGLYVGLNGLDIFDENGDLLSNNSSGKSSVLRIESDRKNLLSSPEFENDPREVSNIVNGTNFTRNDLHVWLAPLGNLENSNENNGNDNSNNNNNNNEKNLITSISIFFKKSITISLIRVFNYNKSRTHCTRGVRDCVFKLDDVTIYDG